MRAVGLLAILSGLSPFALACDDHAPGKEPAHRTALQRTSPALGEVREVDPDQRTIALGHGRIASLRMEPMSSMVLRARDSAAIATLKPGDKVKFRTALIDGRLTVTEIGLAGK